MLFPSLLLSIAMPVAGIVVFKRKTAQETLSLSNVVARQYQENQF